MWIMAWKMRVAGIKQHAHECDNIGHKRDEKPNDKKPFLQ